MGVGSWWAPPQAQAVLPGGERRASGTVDKPSSHRPGVEARPAQGRAPWPLKGAQRPVGPGRILCHVQRAPQAPEEDVRNWPNQSRVWVYQQLHGAQTTKVCSDRASLCRRPGLSSSPPASLLTLAPPTSSSPV